jgi:hypothetical protein
MKKWIVAALLASAALLAQKTAKYRTAPTGYSDTPMLPDGKWRVHDIARPKPAVVTPGAKPGDPPSDAIVLFDGTDLRHWNGDWLVKDGYVQVPARRENGKGLRTKESFGDIQLHLEWAAPTEIDGDSQWRGNSGVVLMGRYELQVLDSFNNPTYADGQAGSVYGQFPPLVNASRKPGEWQTYDIVFEAPRFEGGYLTRPAYITVLHNGVLVQNHQQFIGQMAHRVIRQYEPHGPEAPLELQDHDTPVRYRNIWVRRLAPRP